MTGWAGAGDLDEVFHAVSSVCSICVVIQSIHQRPCPSHHPMRRASWWCKFDGAKVWQW
jgi:hypothetical protein